MVNATWAQGLDVAGLLTEQKYSSSIFLIVFASIVHLIFFRQHSVIRDKDGKPIKELKANARVMKFALSAELSRQGRELAGDAPYIIHNGQSKEFVITQPDHLKDFYKNDTQHHPKPANLNMGAYFGRILGHAVGVQAGERWKIIRKYFDPEFAFRVTVEAMPRTLNLVNQWADQLVQHSISSSKPTASKSFTTDVQSVGKFLPFKIVSQQLYGQVFDEEFFSKLLEMNSLHEEILHDVLLNQRLTSKFWNLLPSKASRRMDEYNRRWKKFNLDAVALARKKNLDCPLERIYRGVDQNNELEELEFLHTVDEILYTNVEISAAVLKTLFTRLAEDQAFQQSLRLEVISQTAAKDSDLAKYVAKTDSLLNFLVMESMRHTPAFWFSLPECTAVAKTIGGYQVPANTAVVIDSGRLNKEAVTWGADGQDFRPERFKEIPQSKCRYGFMKFGAGGASGRCLGKHVADITFKLTVIAVLKKFSLETPNGEVLAATPAAVTFSPN
ncbi:cytochrome P450 [Trichoderma afarasin]